MRTLVVKLTCGAEAPERANQALTVAATAAVAGASVSLWLTGEAAWLAVPGRAADISLLHAVAMDALLEQVLAAGSVTVCSQCAVRRSLEESDLLPGVRVAGAAAYVDEVLTDDVQALVY